MHRSDPECPRFSVMLGSSVSMLEQLVTSIHLHAELLIEANSRQVLVKSVYRWSFVDIVRVFFFLFFFYHGHPSRCFFIIVPAAVGDLNGLQPKNRILLDSYGERTARWKRQRVIKAGETGYMTIGGALCTCSTCKAPRSMLLDVGKTSRSGCSATASQIHLPREGRNAELSHY